MAERKLDRGGGRNSTQKKRNKAAFVEVGKRPRSPDALLGSTAAPEATLSLSEMTSNSSLSYAPAVRGSGTSDGSTSDGGFGNNNCCVATEERNRKSHHRILT